MTAVHKSVSSVVPFTPKLFEPDASDGSRAADDISLREAFVEHLLPDLKTACEESSIDQYWITLRAWERDEALANPPIGKISDPMLSAFRDRRQAAGLRNATIDKNLRNIHTILRRVGPRGDGNPAGKEILRTVPYCAPLGDEEDPRKRIGRRREVSAIYRACEIATWPPERNTGEPPVRLWRRWIVCLYNWGADPADLKRLTVGSIQYGDGSPRQPLRKRLYVTFVRKKTKKKKKRAIILPLHRVVARHVAPLLNGLALGGPSSRPLFPFPKNNRDMKAQYERILAEAGIPLTLKDADGQEIDNKLYFHDFRKTCNSAIDEVAPGIGEEILGHAPQGVNNKHYLLIIARRIRKAIDRLKQPREFGRLERQRRLF